MTFDRRLMFLPALGLIAYWPETDDRIILRAFDLKEAMERSGGDYLLIQSMPRSRVKSGATWEYAVVAIGKHGPLKLALEHAPAGMTMTPDGR